jgi:hypothetical protein
VNKKLVVQDTEKQEAEESKAATSALLFTEGTLACDRLKSHRLTAKITCGLHRTDKRSSAALE